MKKEHAQWLVLAGFILLCFVAAGVGSRLTSLSIHGWYDTLKRPAWTPPDSVFAPVWTALYLAMALAAWIVWRERGFRGALIPLTAFGIQLLLNMAWSAAFFGLRSPLAGFAVIVMLWWSILATLLAFWRVNALAGLLFIPYLAWVTFAMALNYAIWQMNA